MAEPSPETVFAKSDKGIEEIRSRTVKLPRDAGLVFLSIDGKASAAELLPRSGMPAAQFYRTLEMLEADGYIAPASSGSGRVTTASDEGAGLRDLHLGGAVERARPFSGSSRRPANLPADIDVAERARELKARLEERRARAEAERSSREAPPFDLPAAPADAHAGRADPRASTSANIDADHDSSAEPPRPESIPPAYSGGATQATNRFPADRSPHEHRATGAIDTDAARSAALRIEDDGTTGEKLTVDRAVHDVLAEAAEARRSSESVLRAQGRAEHAEGHAAHTVAAHRPKRRLRFGIAALVLLIALPLFGMLWLQFVPLTNHRAEVEQALSTHLQQPVKLGSVRYVLLPTPRIVLEGVAIGADAGVRVQRIEAQASPFALFDQPKHFRNIEIENAVIAPAMLATLPSLLSGDSASDVRVSHVQLSNLRIDVPGATIAPFEGDVSFASNGRVEQALLTNDNLKIRLAPGKEGVSVRLDANAWTIPFGPPLQFSYFTAIGRLNDRALAIDEFTGRVAGGYMQANGTLRWPGALVVQGAFTLQNVRLDELLPALTRHVSAKGALEADGRYEMRGDSAEALVASSRVDASFRVSRGEIENLDLLRGFHAPGASSSRGGRTPFDKLTGTLHASPAGYEYRQVRLSSGPFNATGAFDVAPGGKLSGRVNAELVVGTHIAARSAFEVSGTVSEPVLRR